MTTHPTGGASGAPDTRRPTFEEIALAPLTDEGRARRESEAAWRARDDDHIDDTDICEDCGERHGMVDGCREGWKP